MPRARGELLSRSMLLPRTKEPSVTIIILHYRGYDTLYKCLESIFEMSYGNFSVVLVDNGSRDGSVEPVSKLYEDKLKVIKNPSNLGFVRGNNIALQDVNTKYVVLLNDDTVVDSNWLRYLVDTAESDPSIGACQPKLKLLRNPRYFEYNGACGGMLDVHGTPLCRGRIFELAEEDRGQYDTIAEVFWASGAALFLRADALRKVGLLDPVLYAHMEEIDLCWRMRLAGYKVVCVPKSIVHHVGGSTWDQRSNEEKYYLKHRNNLITMLKNYSAQSLLRFFTVRVFLDAMSWVYFLAKKENDRLVAVPKAYTSLLRNAREIYLSRQQVQQRRRVPDSNILSAMIKKSVVIQYYLLGRRFFSELDGLPLSLSRYLRESTVRKS